MAFICVYCGLSGSFDNDGSHRRGESCRKSPSGVHKIFTFREPGGRCVCNYCGVQNSGPTLDKLYCRKSPDKAHDWHEL